MTLFGRRRNAPGVPSGDGPWRPALTAVLPVWLGSRLAVALLTVVGSWLLTPGLARDRPSLLQTWDRWDVGLYRKVAEHGYFSNAYVDLTEPFFPGLPLVMRAVHVLVPDWTAAGLLVSFCAGGVALVALWRLAEMESGQLVAGRAVLYVVVFPYSVFLAAGYSEALFLAFAVPAWLAARKGAWPLACLLAAGASATRVTGVVLAAGLAVELLGQRVRLRPSGSRVCSVASLRMLADRRVPLLVVPLLPVAGYFGYLHARTGRWDAYSEALRVGWGRDTVSPVSAFQTTVLQARNLDQASPYLWSWRAEIVALGLGLLVTALLLATRRWAEATYVGLNVALLSISSYYASGTRALLVWFPAFLLLARWTARRPAAHAAVLWVMAPLAAGITIAFTRGTWVG